METANNQWNKVDDKVAPENEDSAKGDLSRQSGDDDGAYADLRDEVKLLDDSDESVSLKIPNILKKITELGLSASETRKILHKIKEQTHVPVGALRSDLNDIGGHDGTAIQESVAKIILRHLESRGVEFWQTKERVAHITVQHDGKTEHLSLDDRSATLWLIQRYYELHQDSVSDGEMRETINLLKAKALCEGCTYDAFVRVGHKDGAIYLDLANEKGEVVEISKEGWKVTDNPAVRFRRPNGVLPLPYPARDGDIELLRSIINYGSEENWILIVSFLISTLRHQGPFPILCINGPQGSGKTGTVKTLKYLIDPSAADVRSASEKHDDLIIAANNGWLLSFDNLSEIPRWQSDALCRMATGGGCSKRELYTNSNEVIFDVQRPVIINGIPKLAVYPDLLDRCIVIDLPTISDEDKQREKVLQEKIKEHRPSILGALLDAVSEGLRNSETFELDTHSRMADFEHFIVACEPKCPWSKGTFLKVYRASRSSAIDEILDDNTVAICLRTLLDDKPQWTGTSQELLDIFGKQFEDRSTPKDLPKTAKAMSNALRRLHPTLKTVEILATPPTNKTRGTGGRREWIIEKVVPVLAEENQSTSTVSDGSDDDDPFSSPPGKLIPTSSDGSDGSDDDIPF